jgi:hypothetical protein
VAAAGTQSGVAVLTTLIEWQLPVAGREGTLARTLYGDYQHVDCDSIRTDWQRETMRALGLAAQVGHTGGHIYLIHPDGYGQAA